MTSSGTRGSSAAVSTSTRAAPAAGGSTPTFYASTKARQDQSLAITRLAKLAGSSPLVSTFCCERQHVYPHRHLNRISLAGAVAGPCAIESKSAKNKRRRVQRQP